MAISVNGERNLVDLVTPLPGNAGGTFESRSLPDAMALPPRHRQGDHSRSHARHCRSGSLRRRCSRDLCVIHNITSARQLDIFLLSIFISIHISMYKLSVPALALSRGVRRSQCSQLIYTRGFTCLAMPPVLETKALTSVARVGNTGRNISPFRLLWLFLFFLTVKRSGAEEFPRRWQRLLANLISLLC